MDVGVGLPSTIPGAGPERILAWARAAEEHGFATLAAIDRLVYGNTEPLVTLGAAAAVTSRIRLMTSILLVPFRANAALVAKQAATVNHLSGGRVVLGMAVGGYEDDYAASGVPFAGRGSRFDAMLDEMTRVWAGEQIGPWPGIGRSQIVFGGGSERTFARVARWGSGWIAGSRGVETFRRGSEGVRRAWDAASREGTPRLMAQPYFSLGERARENAETFLGDHYAKEGEAGIAAVLSSTLTSAEAVREAVAAYADAGCDELLLFPCDPEPEQVRLLAEALR